MMLRALAIALVCAAATRAVAAEPIPEVWPRADMQLLGATLGVMAIDWAQTRDLVRRQWQEAYATPACADPETRDGALSGPCPLQRVARYQELNPLLPRNPTQPQVDRYFAAALLGTVGLAYALPATYRRYFLGGVLVLETVVVLRNHRIGLRVQF